VPYLASDPPSLARSREGPLTEPGVLPSGCGVAARLEVQVEHSPDEFVRQLSCRIRRAASWSWTPPNSSSSVQTSTRGTRSAGITRSGRLV